MSGAVRSRVDPSVLHAMKTRRRHSEQRAVEKLAILRRLYLQHGACNLPRAPETQVEQSFNEQFFARVFDYTTLLSHGAVPYNLQPKTYGSEHFDDFGIGFFDGGATDDYLASAELKRAGTDLDAPQGSKYGGLTPVQQAFRRAREHASCRWVLVSNFVELRLYDVHDESEPLAVADLHAVRNADDLATLAAHFDRRALLPNDGTESEMKNALDPSHPQQPVPPEAGKHRMVFRFTPLLEQAIPTHRLERALIDAVEQAAMAREFFGVDVESKVLVPPVTLREGWLSVEASQGTLAVRLAMSRFGEVQLSVRRSPENIQYEITPYRLTRFAKFFADLLYRAHVSLGAFVNSEGTVGAELREVNGARLWHQSGDSVDLGSAATDPIVTDDFLCTPVHSPVIRSATGHFGNYTGVAECVCELTIHFRRPENGTGVRLDETKVLAQVEPKPT